MLPIIIAIFINIPGIFLPIADRGAAPPLSGFTFAMYRNPALVGTIERVSLSPLVSYTDDLLIFALSLAPIKWGGVKFGASYKYLTFRGIIMYPVLNKAIITSSNRPHKSTHIFALNGALGIDKLKLGMSIKYALTEDYETRWWYPNNLEEKLKEEVLGGIGMLYELPYLNLGFSLENVRLWKSGEAEFYKTTPSFRGGISIKYTFKNSIMFYSAFDISKNLENNILDIHKVLGLTLWNSYYDLGIGVYTLPSGYSFRLNNWGVTIIFSRALQIGFTIGKNTLSIGGGFEIP